MTCTNTVTALQATTFEVSALSCCPPVTETPISSDYVADNFVPSTLTIRTPNVSPYPPDDTTDPPTIDMIVPENFVAYPNDPHGGAGGGQDQFSPEVITTLITIPTGKDDEDIHYGRVPAWD